VTAEDRQQLETAEGWSDLGDWQSANDELERMTPALRAQPEVLAVRYDVYSRSKKWDEALEVAQTFSVLRPDLDLGWIYAAYALHELKRTAEAREVLLTAVGKFPTTCRIYYNLACFAAQLGKLNEAYGWLKRAIELDPRTRSIALKDKDLEPIRLQIEAA
jgi:tetratricopeptide (TPR) repeat protein